MLGRDPRQASRSASVARRQQLAGTAPTRITALIVASLCTVLLSPACAGAASEQTAYHSSRGRSSVASATAAAAAAPDAHLSATPAAAGGMQVRLVGEALADAAAADAGAAIAGVVQNAYLAAFGVPAHANVLSARAISGVSPSQSLKGVWHENDFGIAHIWTPYDRTCTAARKIMLRREDSCDA